MGAKLAFLQDAEVRNEVITKANKPITSVKYPQPIPKLQTDKELENIIKEMKQKLKPSKSTTTPTTNKRKPSVPAHIPDPKHKPENQKPSKQPDTLNKSLKSNKGTIQSPSYSPILIPLHSPTAPIPSKAPEPTNPPRHSQTFKASKKPLNSSPKHPPAKAPPKVIADALKNTDSPIEEKKRKKESKKEEETKGVWSQDKVNKSLAAKNKREEVETPQKVEGEKREELDKPEVAPEYSNRDRMRQV